MEFLTDAPRDPAATARALTRADARAVRNDEPLDLAANRMAEWQADEEAKGEVIENDEEGDDVPHGEPLRERRAYIVYKRFPHRIAE